MKKLLIIAAIASTTVLTSNAADATQMKSKQNLTMQEQIRLDAQRDPYAEAAAISPIVIRETIITEGYIAPEAAEHMQPSKYFELRNGNTIVRQ